MNRQRSPEKQALYRARLNNGNPDPECDQCIEGTLRTCSSADQDKVYALSGDSPLMFLNRSFTLYFRSDNPDFILSRGRGDDIRGEWNGDQASLSVPIALSGKTVQRVTVQLHKAGEDEYRVACKLILP